METPIKIANLAFDLIKLMGYEPESDIKIVYTGLRPDEKLYEALIIESKGIVRTTREKNMVLHGDKQHYYEMEKLLSDLAGKAKVHDACGIKEVRKK